jgi:hypothetical protein
MEPLSIEVLAAAGVGFGFTLALPLIERVRHAFMTWRLRRRLERDPYMLRDEYRDYTLAIGGEPEPIAPHLRDGAAAAIAFAIGAWALKLDMQDVFDVTLALLVVVVAARSVWRLLNDPDDVLIEADPDKAPEAQRKSAWLGLGVSVVLLAFVIWKAGWL